MLNFLDSTSRLNITFGDVELELELAWQGELLARLEQVELVTAGQLSSIPRARVKPGRVTDSIGLTFADFRVDYIDQLNVSIPTYDISTSQLAGMYPDNRLNALIGGLDTNAMLVARGLPATSLVTL